MDSIAISVRKSVISESVRGEMKNEPEVERRIQKQTKGGTKKKKGGLRDSLLLKVVLSRTPRLAAREGALVRCTRG